MRLSLAENITLSTSLPFKCEQCLFTSLSIYNTPIALHVTIQHIHRVSTFDYLFITNEVDILPSKQATLPSKQATCTLNIKLYSGPCSQYIMSEQ
jgi:hypothetical protein